MEMKQNPFSFYDFLGYFTPGAIFLYSAVLASGHAQNPAEPTAMLRDLFATDNAAFYLPFILFSYVVGHLLSYLSSVTVERYSVWMHGYPSRFLLGNTAKSFWAVREDSWLRQIGHCVGVVVLLPIALPDLILGRGLRLRDLYARQLDGLLVNVIKSRMSNAVSRLDIFEALKKAVGDEVAREEIKSYDFFRLIYHYAVAHAPSHLSKMQNYVALYGFLRTLTLIFVCAFWVIVWHSATNPMPLVLVSKLGFGTMALSYVAYAAFVKFYRRFSLEAMMAISVIHPTEAKP